MMKTESPLSRSERARVRVIGYIAFVVASLAFAACGNADSPDSFGSGDYVIVGNLVLLCQGRDSETALQNCEALHAALQN